MSNAIHAAESHGKITHWNDAKGFGFIAPVNGQSSIFVHISAVRGERRLQAGDEVLYTAKKDGDGRLAATHVRLASGLTLDDPGTRIKPGKKSHAASATGKAAKTSHTPRRQSHGSTTEVLFKLLLFVGLCSLPLLAVLRIWRELNFFWPAVIYGVTSLLTFTFYWSDKRRAQTGERRIAEKSLHTLELLGGWPGALLAQQVLRHKTRKFSFQFLFWLIVLVHEAGWADYLLSGGHFAAQVLAFLVGR